MGDSINSTNLQNKTALPPGVKKRMSADVVQALIQAGAHINCENGAWHYTFTTML